MELAGEVLDLGFGAAVDVIVQFAAETVLHVLAVLTHHDDGGLDAGEHGEEEVEQDVGVGVPGFVAAQHVADGWCRRREDDGKAR